MCDKNEADGYPFVILKMTINYRVKGPRIFMFGKNRGPIGEIVGRKDEAYVVRFKVQEIRDFFKGVKSYAR